MMALSGQNLIHLFCPKMGEFKPIYWEMKLIIEFRGAAKTRFFN